MITDIKFRQFNRDRRRRGTERVVGVDQSLSNCAMVLFEDGLPIERKVFHTGDPLTKKHRERLKRGDTIFGEFYESHQKQVSYITGQVVEQIYEWKADKVCLEGLAFSATGKVERQLAGLFHSIFVCLERELGLEIDKDLHIVTPTQAKAFARDFLPKEKQYTGAYTSRGKPKLNPMKKPDMLEALQQTEHAWLVDGYTRENLVASRKVETGLHDIPDAYFIGKYFIENLPSSNKQG